MPDLCCDLKIKNDLELKDVLHKLCFSLIYKKCKFNVCTKKRCYLRSVELF